MKFLDKLFGKKDHKKNRDSKKKGITIFVPREPRYVNYKKLDQRKIQRIVEATGCGVMAAINAVAGVTYSPRLLGSIQTRK